MKKHIIINIQDSGIYYNSKDRIDWDRTNFPNKQFFGISRSNEWYWLVEMKEFIYRTIGCFRIEHFSFLTFRIFGVPTVVRDTKVTQNKTTKKTSSFSAEGFIT